MGGHCNGALKDLPTDTVQRALRGLGEEKFRTYITLEVCSRPRDRQYGCAWSKCLSQRLSTFSVFSHVQYCVSSSFAAAAASSFLRGFMVPEIRYLKSLEAIPQHANHAMTPSRRTVSILSIPKQSRHLLPSSERIAPCPRAAHPVDAL